MSKERKIINQQMIIERDAITISDLVTSIPMGFSGPVYVYGSILILDEDILNFDYNNIWIFNDIHLSGNLVEIIDKKKLNFSRINQTNLIIQGDFFCDHSINLENLGLEVRGNFRTYEQVEAKNLKISEDFNCDIASIAENLIVRGNFTAESSVSASYIDVRGDFCCEKITAKDINVLGNLTFDNAAASFEGINVERKIYVRNNLYSSKLSAGEIIVGGNCLVESSIESLDQIMIDGNLNAYSVESYYNLIIKGKMTVTHYIDTHNHKIING